MTMARTFVRSHASRKVAARILERIGTWERYFVFAFVFLSTSTYDIRENKRFLKIILKN